MKQFLVKYELCESSGVTDADVAKIAKMIDRNHHTEAYIAGAKALGASKYVKLFELIKGIEKLENHLPGGVSDYRYYVYSEMMKLAKQNLSQEEYDKFYSAF